ncbi:Rieske (2Fe-2S) protein [Cryptosporangium arvum]|uniref:Cytochrome bc1 complex Rieske iron-sulfur subunit n=1 Tax=Cryptosporangium arvum DSM 44712 TaxID=927661 RepID=A0A010ZRZ3_9ACTN|nr:Rieske (2Fe-2S) protein [Cryptosporangium arvum]EXG79987.1 ferredoxin subunit of nitrite reductase and ring-hydroxylating dioxygenase [Cryptosporangium arvum DSM 44712]
MDNTRYTRGLLNRRSVLAGAGAVGVTIVASACSSYGDSASSDAAPASSAPAAAPTTGAASAEAPPAADALAKVADIPVGGGKIFDAEGVVVTQPEAGTFKAFSNVCTHQGCKVNKVATTIDCPCHASKFSISDGSPTAGPAKKPLAEKQVTVNGDSITLA